MKLSLGEVCGCQEEHFEQDKVESVVMFFNEFLKNLYWHFLKGARICNNNAVYIPKKILLMIKKYISVG